MSDNQNHEEKDVDKKNASKERCISITYKDSKNNIKQVLMPFGDYYDNEESYKENVQNVVADIRDDGGFWLDDKTIIPFHKIELFETSNETKDKVVAKKETSQNGNPKQKLKGKRRSRFHHDKHVNLPHSKMTNVDKSKSELVSKTKQDQDQDQERKEEVVDE